MKARKGREMQLTAELRPLLLAILAPLPTPGSPEWRQLKRSGRLGVTVLIASDALMAGKVRMIRLETAVGPFVPG